MAKVLVWWRISLFNLVLLDLRVAWFSLTKIGVLGSSLSLMKVWALGVMCLSPGFLCLMRARAIGQDNWVVSVHA